MVVGTSSMVLLFASVVVIELVMMRFCFCRTGWKNFERVILRFLNSFI